MKYGIEFRDGEIRFASLPLWQGAQDTAGVRLALPLSLGVDPRGYLRQTTPPETQRSIIDGYGKGDYVHFTPPPGSSAWADQLGRSQVAFISKYGAFTSDARVLEIGAGSGYVAAEIAREFRTARPVIVDPALIDCVDPRIEVVAEYFPTEKLAKREFDRILSFNCLEHVEDPFAFLQQIRSHLSENGRAILSFPETSRQFERGDLNVISHEHISYFNKETAEALLESAGLIPIATDVRDDSLWVVVQPTTLPVRRNHTFDGKVYLERAWTAFDTAISESRDAIQKHLASGDLVGFHGATNGLNTFLFATGLRGERIAIFDGDTTKVGKYVAASPTPIRHCDDPDYSLAAVIFVSAMTFYPEIVRGAACRHHIAESKFRPLFGSCPV